jgi:hypothetical protein
MIQAVKVESTALDSMRDKLKEVDNLRTQISAFTKRLIDADQANLNLKTNLMKSQEAFTELKKQKAEVNIMFLCFCQINLGCFCRLNRRWFHFAKN